MKHIDLKKSSLLRNAYDRLVYINPPTEIIDSIFTFYDTNILSDNYEMLLWVASNALRFYLELK